MNDPLFMTDEELQRPPSGSLAGSDKWYLGDQVGTPKREDMPLSFLYGENYDFKLKPFSGEPIVSTDTMDFVAPVHEISMNELNGDKYILRAFEKQGFYSTQAPPEFRARYNAVLARKRKNG
jgi:hypothetical protein